MKLNDIEYDWTLDYPRLLEDPYAFKDSGPGDFKDLIVNKMTAFNSKIENKTLLSKGGLVNIPTDLSDKEVLRMYHANENQVKKQTYYNNVCNMLYDFWNKEIGIHVNWSLVDIWAQQIVEKNWSD